MRQSVAKASRRDLRRAVGDESIALIDKHARRIATLDVLLGDTHSMIAGHDAEIGNLWRAATDHEKRLDQTQEFLNRGVVARLRWLVTGR